MSRSAKASWIEIWYQDSWDGLLRSRSAKASWIEIVRQHCAVNIQLVEVCEGLVD